MSTVSYAIWAFAAGALIPLMAILNAGLARAVGGPVQAAVILFAVGLVSSLLVAATATARIPELTTLARIPFAHRRLLRTQHHVSCATVWRRQRDSICGHGAAPVFGGDRPLRIGGSVAAAIDSHAAFRPGDRHHRPGTDADC